MRSTILVLLAFLPVVLDVQRLDAQPAQRLDAVQGETALRLVREGDGLRLFDARSTEVVYEPLTVASRRVIEADGARSFLINGERFDLANVWLPEVDEPRRFANLATLLGLTVDGVPAELPRALDPALDLAVHAGFYTGILAERPAQLSLALDGRRLEGFFGEENSTSTSTSTSTPSAGLLVLTGQSYNATRTRGETLELIARDARDRILAVVRGALDPESRTFSGTWTPLDGATARPFTFSRAADYTIRESRRGTAAFTAVYPRFRHPPLSELNDLLEAASRAAEETFLDAWSDVDAAPGLFHRQRREVLVSYLRPELVSLRQKLDGPEGGALGPQSSASNYRHTGDGFTVFSLRECVRPAARERLAELVAARLRDAGQAPPGLGKLDPAALERFYLVPGGIRILLPSMAPRRRSGDTDAVVLGFGELAEILDPQGPLGRFASLQ